MADPTNWAGIQRHGLLSTTALLDLFEVTGPQREALESQRRPESVNISHPVHGTALIRDQKPMTDSGLQRALRDGLSPREWYQIINRKVFFWVNASRLDTLLRAQAYRGTPHLVLTVDTAALLGRHLDRVTLSPMNSGATRPMPHPRGRDTFLGLDEYPFMDRARRGLEPVVELAVEYAVADIMQLLISAEQVSVST
jgi:hypothetical protein